ncbi:MAG: hypothetical protein U9N45_05500, partial [Gemmatimonadota bacterium]|nr:hypothetical protein [Gemmatimonadota bacterium]
RSPLRFYMPLPLCFYLQPIAYSLSFPLPLFINGTLLADQFTDNTKGPLEKHFLPPVKVKRQFITARNEIQIVYNVHFFNRFFSMFEAHKS